MRNPLGIFTKIFAGNANASERHEFEDFEEGWDTDYSVETSGKRPERIVFNDLFAKVTAVCSDVNTYGGSLPWDITIPYAQHAIVTFTDGNMYVSLVADNIGNSPSTSPASWSLVETGGGSPIVGGVLDMGDAVLRFRGTTSGGVARIADVSWDFDNNVFTVQVSDE